MYGGWAVFPAVIIHTPQGYLAPASAAWPGGGAERSSGGFGRAIVAGRDLIELSARGPDVYLRRGSGRCDSELALRILRLGAVCVYVYVQSCVGDAVLVIYLSTVTRPGIGRLYCPRTFAFYDCLREIRSVFISVSELCAVKGCVSLRRGIYGARIIV